MADLEPPVISRFDPGSEAVLVLSIAGEGGARRELTRLADEVVSRRIQNIPGVGNVSVVGGLKREIHALLLPDRMEALSVSPDMVVAALERENGDVPAGLVEQGNAENLVRVAGMIRESRSEEHTS